MKNEDSSDLFGIAIEEVECHECRGDKKENRKINTNDHRSVVVAVAKEQHLSIQQAENLVGQFY